MATSISSIQPVAIRACATSGNRKPDSHRRKGASSGWWTPLFGWSPEPDYIDSGNGENDKNALTAKVNARSDSDLDPRPAKSRLAPGSFTEEKARKLRMMTTETESFHDKMYHSAIASRLASDFSHLSDQ